MPHKPIFYIGKISQKNPEIKIMAVINIPKKRIKNSNDCIFLLEFMITNRINTFVGGCYLS
jgi:hypothetical protein